MSTGETYWINILSLAAAMKGSLDMNMNMAYESATNGGDESEKQNITYILLKPELKVKTIARRIIAFLPRKVKILPLSFHEQLRAAALGPDSGVLNRILHLNLTGEDPRFVENQCQVNLMAF